jgi:hypothetical protein
MASLEPFCDFLKLSVPLGELPFLRDRLEPLVVEAGGHARTPDLFDLGELGTVKFGTWGKVGTVGVSGDALGALRRAELFLRFLSAVAECPHRVTGVDLAVDVAEDGPVVVAGWRERGLAGGVQLTRKVLRRDQVNWRFGPGVVDGRETGTVYLGNRKMDVWAKVYDKRNELLKRAVDRHGRHPSVVELNDPGPLTRYEVTCGRHVGATLRDVVEPAALFWKFASSLLERPEGVPEWESQAMGFELPRWEPDPVRQLRLLLESSADVKRVLKLVHQLGGPAPDEGLARLRGYLLHGRMAA